MRVCFPLEQLAEECVPSLSGRPPGDHWLLWGWVWTFQSPAPFWWTHPAWNSPLLWWWSKNTKNLSDIHTPRKKGEGKRSESTETGWVQKYLLFQSAVLLINNYSATDLGLLKLKQTTLPLSDGCSEGSKLMIHELYQAEKVYLNLEYDGL